MGVRRRELQIFKEILTLCLNGARITQLMYKANLSYSTLHKYLHVALRQGLIRKVCNDDGSVVFWITDKGRLLLERLREVKQVLQF